MSGWDTDLEAFVDYGRTITYLESSSYVQGSGTTNADVVPGTPVTVTVRLNNPKALSLNYTISANSALVDGTVAAPASTTGAVDGITTVSFTFTPTAAAEHGDIEFRLGLSSPAINRTFAPATFKVRCDSPPGPITVIKAGKRSDGKPCIAFMLPEDDANADIAAVEIMYKNASAGTSKTVTEAVSRTGTGLTTPPLPAPLGTGDGKYVRYFSPDDTTADNPYDFTVTPIDASDKKSGTPATASIAGDELFLGYDPNGGTGAVAAVYGYQTTTTAIIADGSSLSRPGYAFSGWKDDTGASYSSGASYTFGTTNIMLHAQWQNVTMEIGSATQLAALATQPSLSGTYVLTSDIDMSAVTDFVPIGSLANNFTGIFDGGGHTISNLTTTTVNGDAGLFGYISSGAVISNVRLKNVNVSSTGTGSGDDGIGGLVGENYGIITHCSVSGTVSGCRRVGGLVGNNRTGASISECYSSVSVIAAWDYAGGLVGSNWGAISNCYARSTVKNVDGGYCGSGGLCGSQDSPGTIKNCYAAGIATGTTTNGGLLASNGVGATVSTSYYDTSISGLSDSDKGTPESTTDMKTPGTYGWDFASIWTIDSGKNGGYPYLRNLPVGDQITIPSGTTASTFHDLLANNPDGSFILSGNLDLSGYTWTPIGISGARFCGIFDGNGKTISGLTVAENSYTGMFAFVDGGTVKNLHLTGVDIQGATGSQKGALVGESRGLIYRCASSGTVRGATSVGGLVGSNLGTVSECWSDATVTADLYSGGLVGANGSNSIETGNIINCYARGTVTVTWGGGLAGSNNSKGTITNSYAAAPMIASGCSGSGNGFLQGLIGNSGGTQPYSFFDLSKIATSYNSGAVTSTYFGTAESTTAMKTQTPFTAAGWDFGSVWTFTAGKNGGYPCLINNVATSDISVSTQSGLDAIRSKLDGDYVLSGDVTLSGNWTPIGSSGSPFTGTFDGQGHTITGLTINATSGSQAMFAETSPTACVMNVGLKDVAIYSDSGECVSAIVAVNNGTIYRCWASGTIKGQFRIGGIAGKNEKDGTIEECYSIANVETTYNLDAAGTIYWNIGSLVAGNYGVVKNCYSRGTVTGHKLQGIGSFMGYNENTGTTSNSYATGAVSYEASNEGPGGIAGKKDSAGSSTITNCFYDMDTTLMSDTGKGMGMTTANMKLQTNYTGWDFTGVWGIDTTKTINHGYPYLRYFGANTVTP